MSETYSPRTVAAVALGSLIGGFLLIFGGGIVFLRPKARERSQPTAIVQRSDAGAATTATAMPGVEEPMAETPAATATGALPDAGMGASAPEAVPVATAAGITLSPLSISRCFDQGAPVRINGAQCDRLQGIEQHFVTRAADIASCARSGSHGRLSLFIDFRFSTSFAQGWGLPTSSIPDAGNVTACVKQKILPLPYAAVPHAHDRYVVVQHIDW